MNTKEEIVSALHNAAIEVRDEKNKGVAYKLSETLNFTGFNITIQGHILTVLRHSEEDYRYLSNEGYEYDCESELKSYISSLKSAFTKKTGKRIGLKQKGACVTTVEPLSGVRTIVKTTCSYEIARLKEKTEKTENYFENFKKYLNGEK